MFMTFRKIFTTTCILFSVACTTTPTKESVPQKKADTLDGFNRGVHSFNETLDANILKPIAKGYMWATPDLLQQGVTNFFSNINDIGVTANDLMQFKMTQSGMDAGRFIVNTTAGGLGVVDVASMIDLPKHNEDFGQTLGFWGVPAGGFLMLPFIGPSSTREIGGMVGDALFNPFSYTFLFGGGVAVTAATAGARSLDVTNTRASLMGTEKMVNEAAGSDRYNFIKNAYQQRREYLVHDGNVPSKDDVDLFDEDESPAPKNTLSKPASASKLLPSFQPQTDGLPPVINNSRRFLELSTPK